MSVFSQDRKLAVDGCISGTAGEITYCSLLALENWGNHVTCNYNYKSEEGCLFLTRFNKVAIQGTPQMAVDKEAIS